MCVLGDLYSGDERGDFNTVQSKMVEHGSTLEELGLRRRQRLKKGVIQSPKGFSFTQLHSIFSI